ncbi:hypothetical protein BLOT_002305 [Blomia tropicalis]|nr:hypothetical protein BLOT_002305 [Blomia tropicalis]
MKAKGSSNWGFTLFMVYMDEANIIITSRGQLMDNQIASLEPAIFDDLKSLERMTFPSTYFVSIRFIYSSDIVPSTPESQSSSFERQILIIFDIKMFEL